MQTYLKSRPVWVQLFLFLGMAFGSLMVFSLLGNFFIKQIFGTSLFELGNASTWDMSDPQLINIIRAMLVIQFLGLFLIPSLLFAYFSDPHPRKYLGLQNPHKALYWILAVAALIIAFPLVEFTGLINREINLGTSTNEMVRKMEEEATRTIQLMLGRNTTTDLFLNLIFIAAFAGIGEELFFRGVLQRMFIKGFKNPWAGIILAAFCFSFFHMQFLGFIPRFLLGIVLGAIYWYSGSLLTAIFAHFFYDAFIIVWAYFQPELVTNPDASIVDKSSLVITAIVSAALVGLILWWMKKNSSTKYEEVYGDDDPKPSENDLTF